MMMIGASRPSARTARDIAALAVYTHTHTHAHAHIVTHTYTHAHAHAHTGEQLCRDWRGRSISKDRR
jgi:hypothetical protein